MKLIDREGRLFGKISIIDVLVAAIVLFLAAALYVKTNHRAITSTSSNVPIIYQVQVSGLRTYIADAVQVGDQLFDSDRNTSGSLGEIIDIQVSPGQKMIEFVDGMFVDNAPMEDCVNLLLTVKGEGQIDGKTYMINRVYPLGVTASRNLCTKYAQFVGVVTDIQS